MKATLVAARLRIDDTSKAANYVAGRTPLPLRVFHTLIVRFRMSAKYLALGEGCMDCRNFVLTDDVWSRVNLDGTFWEAWQSVFAVAHEKHDRTEEGKVEASLSGLKKFIAEAETGHIDAASINAVAELATDKWGAHPSVRKRVPFPEWRPCSAVALGEGRARENSAN